MVAIAICCHRQHSVLVIVLLANVHVTMATANCLTMTFVAPSQTCIINTPFIYKPLDFHVK